MKDLKRRIKKLEERAGLSAPTCGVIEYDPDIPGDLEAKRAAIEAKYPGIPLYILPTMCKTIEEWQTSVNRNRAMRLKEQDPNAQDQ